MFSFYFLQNFYSFHLSSLFSFFNTCRVRNRMEKKITLAIPRPNVKTQDREWKKASTKIKYCSSPTPSRDNKDIFPCKQTLEWNSILESQRAENASLDWHLWILSVNWEDSPAFHIWLLLLIHFLWDSYMEEKFHPRSLGYKCLQYDFGRKSATKIWTLTASTLNGKIKKILASWRKKKNPWPKNNLE